MSRVAMCICGEPLVSTLAFRKFEFYCVSCGRKYGWLDPTPAPETPELLARMEFVKQRFETLSEGIMGDGGMHTDCRRCMERNEPHQWHASPDEQAADAAARRRLREATGVPHGR